MSEFNDLSTKEKAVFWFDTNKQKIDKILQDALDEELSIRLNLRKRGEDIAEHRPFDLHEHDLYSNPFCDRLRNIDENALWYADVGKSSVKVNGRSYDFHVYFRTFDDLIIDPTIGQFIDLDGAIAQYPNFFEERVFVGSNNEAEQMGVFYPKKFESSVLS